MTMWFMSFRQQMELAFNCREFLASFGHILDFYLNDLDLQVVYLAEIVTFKYRDISNENWVVSDAPLGCIWLKNI